MSSGEATAVFEVIKLVEQVIEKRGLSRPHLKDEVEMYFSYLMQGNDQVNPHERRAAGVSDEQWEKALSEFKSFLGTEHE
jgi:hypothetical protein